MLEYLRIVVVVVDYVHTSSRLFPDLSKYYFQTIPRMVVDLVSEELHEVLLILQRSSGRPAEVLAGTLVHLDLQERRTVGGHELANLGINLISCGGGVSVLVAGGLGNSAEIDVERAGRLAADRVVSTVVDEDVLVVGALGQTSSSQVTHVHKSGTITVDGDYLARGLGKSNTERDSTGMSHRTHSQEITLVTLILGHTVLEHLTGSESGGGHGDVIVIQSRKNDVQGLLPVNLILIGSERLEFVRTERLTLHQKGIRALAVLQMMDSGSDGFPSTLLVVWQNLVFDTHTSQHAAHDLTLYKVLGFILLSGFSTPANQQEHGNTVDLGVSE